jgi:hypothetical protein
MARERSRVTTVACSLPKTNWKSRYPARHVAEIAKKLIPRRPFYQKPLITDQALNDEIAQE